jgi:hypothetical protein
MTMKKLIVIAMTTVLSVLVITVLAQTEGGQEGSGATETQAGGQESTQQKYLDAVQEKRSDRRFYRRPRYRTRNYDLRAEEVTPPVSGSMQDIVNYLMRKDGENTRRIETLEATVAKLEEELRRNSGIERSHWSKVGDLEDKVRLLVRAERRRQRAEGDEESEELTGQEAGESSDEYEETEEVVGEGME